jgi:guanine deaminase
MKKEFMLQAIELSRNNMNAGCGGPFGAVIVKDGRVIGEGWNKVTSTNDPTAHAEVIAIRSACERIKNFSLEGAEIYTSCEPCPMCLSAIYWARIDRIYYANTRKDAADIQFDDEFLYQEIPKDIHDRQIPMIQVGREDAIEVFREWQEKEDKIPY